MNTVRTTNKVCLLPQQHIWQINLGVVNAYQAVPQPKNPIKEVDFLFDRMFCQIIFFVFSNPKEEYLRKPTFEVIFPFLDTMVSRKSTLFVHSTDIDCFVDLVKLRMRHKIIRMCGRWSPHSHGNP